MGPWYLRVAHPVGNTDPIPALQNQDLPFTWTKGNSPTLPHCKDWRFLKKWSHFNLKFKHGAALRKPIKKSLKGLATRFTALKLNKNRPKNGEPKYSSYTLCPGSQKHGIPCSERHNSCHTTRSRLVSIQKPRPETPLRTDPIWSCTWWIWNKAYWYYMT